MLYAQLLEVHATVLYIFKSVEIRNVYLTKLMIANVEDFDKQYLRSNI